MPNILVTTSVSGGIVDYSTLSSAIAAWMSRADLNSRIPDFIQLAEEKLNRRLRCRQMEQALAVTAIVDNEVAIPTGIVAVKALWMDGQDKTPLFAQTLDFVIANKRDGVARHYAWNASTWRFDGTGSVTGVLYKKITPLSLANPTNWVLDNHPSAYLFGALSEAAIYVKDDADRDYWNARQDSVILEIHGNDGRDRFGGPLQSRAR